MPKKSNNDKQGPWQRLKKGGLIAGITGGVTTLGGKIGLAAVGFGSKGVAAGTFAAGLQSSIGNVAAGSAFAAFQSIGALGLSSLVIPGLIVGGVAGGGYCLYHTVRTKL